MRPPLRRPALTLATLAILTALMTLGLTTPARAQDSASAREHYQKGTSYYDLGRYADAIKEFEAAYQIKNDPALLYNLAQSHRLAGNTEQALHFYRTYLRYVPKAPNRVEIEDRIKQLDLLLAQKTAPPNQTIPPPNGTPPTQTAPTPPTAPEPPPAGSPMTTAPPPAAPDPGAGGPPPQPTYAPGVFATAPPANDHHVMIRAGLITAAAGGALFIVGAAYGLAAKGAANEVNQEAVKGMPFDPSVESRGKSAQKAETVLMVLGVLSMAAGGGLYFYGRHARESSRVSVTPVASADQAGAVLRVIF